MWSDLTFPIVIAHRGDKAYAPENTLSAFKQAAEKGADAVEFDVKLTSDGHVIVLHDQTVDRTTSGTGDVSKLSFAAVRDLDASVLFPGQFPEEKIPTLDEVFETVGKFVYLNIELTNYATPNDDLVSKVVELIKKHNISKRIWFSSFLSINLDKAKQLLESVPRGLLASELWRGISARREWQYGRYQSLNPFYLDTNYRLVKKIHSQGGLLFVYTVNRPIEMRRLVRIGVDGIITDNPALALRLLGRGR